mmetsp:Transcript_12075/g.25721  ORF Transcript_12075/g.25721 Transcript_12075/m.25721 type:complete len:136 (+) Transcript_12075:128-535(+)
MIKSPSRPMRSSERGKLLCPAPSFYCPLTMGLMKDPVQDREGNSYEKGAILKWLSENGTSPVTRNSLQRKHLVPNRALKEAIEFEVNRQNEIKIHSKKPRGAPDVPPKQRSFDCPDLSNGHATSARSSRHSTNHH